MPDSIEQKIITAIVARLQTILTTNGFQTNIGAKVRDWETNWQQEDLPAISVFTGRTVSEDAPRERRKTVHSLPVAIQVSLERGTAAANARIAIDDIKKAILGSGTQANNWLAERFPIVEGTPPGLTMVTRETAHQILTPQDSFEIVGAQVEIEILFITEKFNARQ